MLPLFISESHRIRTPTYPTRCSSIGETHAFSRQIMSVANNPLSSLDTSANLDLSRQSIVRPRTGRHSLPGQLPIASEMTEKKMFFPIHYGCYSGIGHCLRFFPIRDDVAPPIGGKDYMGFAKVKFEQLSGKPLPKLWCRCSLTGNPVCQDRRLLEYVVCHQWRCK